MRRLSFAAAVAVLAAACGGPEGAAQSPAQTQTAQTGEPVETRPPNGTNQTPAFPGQTRAPRMSANVDFQVQTVAEGLTHPWSIAFLPDGDMLVTERPGRLRIVSQGGQVSPPATGLPEVDSRRQGGLLDVALAPDYGASQQIYWCYAEPRSGGETNTAVARGRLVRQGGAPRVENAQVIWRQRPSVDSEMHYGCRLVFGPEGNLFVTVGERFLHETRDQAQQLDSALGKVVRLRPDGSVPPDNPFTNREGALPEIWSYGHRNIQAATLHPRTGELWVVDHGPKGGDEINIARAGENYGWPVISYGVQYSGEPVGSGQTQMPGMQQPIYYWDPSIAPSGAAFYEADLFPEWRGSLFVGALAGQHLARLTVDDKRVIGEERLLEDRDQRIRDVVVGPDGAIYLATDAESGEILRLVPAGGR